jgi:hypothetical protein
MSENEVIAADIEAVEPIESVEAQEVETIEEGQADNDSDNGDVQDGESDGEFPKKAVNALNRKTKTINKLRARLQELEAKQAVLSDSTDEFKEVNSDEFERMDDYLKAEIKSSVNQILKQTDTEKQKTQLTQEQQALLAERNQYVAQQAQDTAKSIQDFQQVIGQHTQTLDSMPESVSDIFYSIDNAPLAAYVLAKEGNLESLRYASPYVAANMIMSAEQRGMQLLNRKPQISAAPEPMKGSRGQLKTTKNLMEGSVLKNLGLKS